MSFMTRVCLLHKTSHEIGSCLCNMAQHSFVVIGKLCVLQSIEKEYASIPRCGYKKMGKDAQIVTKHDTLMSSRINACRVLQFPPGIQTGDTGGFDVKLNNKVFNTLRAYSHAQCSRQRAKVLPKSKTHSK